MKSTDVKSLDRLFALAELNEGRCPSPELLDGYIRGTLPEVLREAVDKHVKSCADCREIVTDVKSALATGEPEPQWLVRARTLLEAFAASAANVRAEVVDAIQGAAALAILLGAKPQVTSVRRAATVVQEQPGADPLKAFEQALGEAELSGRPEPTVTLAAPGLVLRLIKLRTGQWALRAKPADAPEWQPFALLAFAPGHEIARLQSEGTTLILGRLAAFTGKRPFRYAIKFVS